MSDGNEERMKDKLLMLKQQGERKNFCEKKWQLGGLPTQSLLVKRKLSSLCTVDCDRWRSSGE
jgi:hypothetical protein